VSANTYTLVVDDESPSHIRFRVFVNHAYAGGMTLRVEEFDDFVDRLDAKVKR